MDGLAIKRKRKDKRIWYVTDPHSRFLLLHDSDIRSAMSRASGSYPLIHSARRQAAGGGLSGRAAGVRWHVVPGGQVGWSSLEAAGSVCL